MAQRQFLERDGLRLAYLDFGGDGPPILALHGHFSRGSTFARVADNLRDRWRVVALDQRGHGWSDSPDDYSREAYIGDAATLIRRLGLAPAIVLGHSLGGVNAYQLAARHPELVGALIIEDIGTVVESDFARFLAGWPERFPAFRAVREFLETKVNAVDYFLESVVEYPDGWGFRFRYRHMIHSQQLINGDWSADWLASTCPALVLHGNKSWAMTDEHAREMVSRRANTAFIEFPTCGHVIHDEDPVGFHRAIREFLTHL